MNEELSEYQKNKPIYTILRITRTAHRKLRILAALTGDSMLGLIDRLATEELARRNRHTGKENER